jgi:hypothetical protein
MRKMHKTRAHPTMQAHDAPPCPLLSSSSSSPHPIRQRRSGRCRYTTFAHAWFASATQSRIALAGVDTITRAPAWRATLAAH